MVQKSHTTGMSKKPWKEWDFNYLSLPQLVSEWIPEDSLKKKPGKQSIGISENRLFNKVDFCFLNNDIYFFQDLDNPACKKRNRAYSIYYISTWDTWWPNLIQSQKLVVQLSLGPSFKELFARSSASAVDKRPRKCRRMGERKRGVTCRSEWCGLIWAWYFWASSFQSKRWNQQMPITKRAPHTSYM